MRLFLAIQLSPELRRALRAVQDELRRRGVRGNYTHPENLHLTLAFIGDYPDADEVLEALAPLRFELLRLELSGLGSFGELWWAGLADRERPAALAAQIRRLLADAGIPFDRKRFSPHITLIRQPEYARDPQLGTLQLPGASMTAGRVSLMLSTRGKGGVIYTELGSVPLGEDTP